MLPMAGICYLNKKAVITLVVSKLNRKFAAKTIIMRSYGRKIIDYIFKRWAECLRLIKIAKEQGLYIDKSDWGKFGDRRMIPTGERTYRRRINDTLFVSVDPSHPYR